MRSWPYGLGLGLGLGLMYRISWSPFYRGISRNSQTRSCSTSPCWTGTISALFFTIPPFLTLTPLSSHPTRFVLDCIVVSLSRLGHVITQRQSIQVHSLLYSSLPLRFWGIDQLFSQSLHQLLSSFVKNQLASTKSLASTVSKLRQAKELSSNYCVVLSWLDEE